MIDFRAVNGPTGRLLRGMLIERGIELGGINPRAVVSYGMSLNTALPSLNANATRHNKLQQLEVLRATGISVPPFSLDGTGLNFPMLGRKLHHVGGKDIVPILGRDQEWPIRQRQSDFFTQYVPREHEFRVWAFRGTVKGTYEKVLAHPGKLGKRIGANYDNGFSFNIVQGAPERVKDIGSRAIAALGLDFGAVDILQGPGGTLYVLEVNTAPGVEGPRQGLTGLADSIARWVRNGFPRRNGATR